MGDRLFHTLDPTTRSFELSGRDYLLTDTVGFIEKLPHQLVEAFKATLEETVLADLILHVVDAAAPEERRLADMRGGRRGAGGDRRRREAAAAGPQQGRPARRGRARRGAAAPPRRGAGLGARPARASTTLRERVEAAFEDTLAEVELLVPYSEGARLHELHEVAGDLERTEREDGVLVHAKVPVAELHRFDDLRTAGAA